LKKKPPTYAASVSLFVFPLFAFSGRAPFSPYIWALQFFGKKFAAAYARCMQRQDSIGGKRRYLKSDSVQSQIDFRTL
jgi:hypothetical protein